MKKLFFAALTALSVAVAPAYAASTIAGDRAATVLQQTRSYAISQNSKRFGWTGRTFVIGSHSSIAGDRSATQLQQTGSYGGGG